ncbi:MAG: DMT family transporter [Gammaproteobacteria bacterium]|nr:DMT family transporter [Gammaproteobacteria bacterium]
MTSAFSKKTPFVKAGLIIILAIFLFDIQGVFIKYMGAQYPIEQITVIRNFLGMIPYFLMLLVFSNWRKTDGNWKIKRWKFAFFRGVLLILAQLCFYTALINMELATATTLAFCGPLFLTLLSIPMFGHKVGWYRGSAVILGFIGVIMVMQPGRDAFSFYALLPIGAGFFYALASLTSRYFSQELPTALISIYASIGAVVTALGVVLLQGQWVSIESLGDGFLFIGMGLSGGFAVLLLITAYRMADPSSLSPLEYFGIPFSFVLGWLFFDEAPFGSLFPGVLFIVGAGLLVLWRERVIANTQT